MRTVIAHAHIFKNAGSTLDWSLQRSFGGRFLDHRDDRRMKEGGGEHLWELLEAQPGLVAVSSHHMPADLPRLANWRVVPIYMVRHPLERIGSVYEFEKRQMADTRGARAAKKYNFRDYVAWRMQAGVGRTIRNYQTLYVAGEFDAENARQLDFSLLQLALERLKKLPLIGVVDRYDEFMVVVEERLGGPLPGLDLAYRRQNESGTERPPTVARRVAKVLRELGELQRQVIDENAMDLILYQLARRRLDEAIGRIVDFEAKLAAFKTRCATVQGPRR